MAFRDRQNMQQFPKVIASTLNGFLPIYNVTYAVGVGAYNVRDDVLLVQFFLKKIFEHPQTPYPKPVGVKPMKVDGWIGQITNGWIRHYQNELVAKGKKIVKDTRVDRSPVGGTKIAYTIDQANSDMADLYPERFESLWGFTDFPPELTTILYSS